MSFELSGYRSFLGDHFVKRMEEETYVTLGGEAFSRQRLVSELGIPSLRAARILSMKMSELGIESFEDLYAMEPTEIAAMKGVGTTTLFVLLRAFERKRKNVSAWTKKSEVTFDTLKARWHKEQAVDRKAEAEAKRREKAVGRRQLTAAADTLLAGASKRRAG
jgi:hypothetical protein